MSSTSQYHWLYEAIARVFNQSAARDGFSVHVGVVALPRPGRKNIINLKICSEDEDSLHDFVEAYSGSDADLSYVTLIDETRRAYLCEDGYEMLLRGTFDKANLETYWDCGSSVDVFGAHEGTDSRRPSRRTRMARTRTRSWTSCLCATRKGKETGRRRKRKRSRGTRKRTRARGRRKCCKSMDSTTLVKLIMFLLVVVLVGLLVAYGSSIVQ